ncbi:hypothetical protein ASPSYDRAFT_85227 [Aspergillus sydowii CBS 593.65]|uniref:Uncharacterized protein n=1 Tax=Aspergillus sydowii CBS 593.65 TaxID=1036612 RepID=A0A1L9U0P0_9EURO|nr:uncharacterized protein ASPSYDRAFT_85227 [Aspergillus sydowii CBS 593.65]OJJ65254.1 hypothetical protein ASPSYDRAFT_85227 [Aspergillus sydowii CBS 593.65]
MGRHYSPGRFPKGSIDDSPGAYMSGGLGYGIRRSSLREDTLSALDHGHRKSKNYADTVHPGDSISQVGRPHFVKPGQCVETPPRKFDHYEQISRRGSSDDYRRASPKSSSRRASYAGEQYKNHRYGDKASVHVKEDPMDMRLSEYRHDTRYLYKSRYGDNACVHVEEAPVYERRSGHRDDRSRSSYREDQKGVVIVRRKITPPGSSSSSNRQSARGSSEGASGGSSRSSGGSPSDPQIQWERHWKDLTYGETHSFQHYDFKTGVKSRVTPEIGQDGVCGVAARDDSRGTLIVTEGRVDTYVKVPRMVFVEGGKQALAHFRPVSLERLREYAESVDNDSAPPMPGDENKRGFWIEPQNQSLMVGRGTVERTVLDVEIAYLGSASSARSSRAREDERRREDERKDYEDLLRASSHWDSHYDSRRLSAQRHRYYQENDRYGRYS